MEHSDEAETQKTRERRRWRPGEKTRGRRLTMRQKGSGRIWGDDRKIE